MNITRYLSILILTLLASYAFPKGKSTKSFPKPSTGFIENKGQIIDQNNTPNPAVLYLLNTPGMNVQLRKGGFSYDLYSLEKSKVKSQKSKLQVKSQNHNDSIFSQFTTHDSQLTTFHRIDFNLLNSNPNCKIITSEPTSDYLNYYGVEFPVAGIKNVRQYKNITYKNIYPKIDLEFVTGDEMRYKYNFIIHPGANINDIRLKIEGSDRLTLIDDTLKVITELGEVNEVIPESYFQSQNVRIIIKTHFCEIIKGIFGFSIDGKIQDTSTLVIDPTCLRLWGTYYGGGSSEYGWGSSIDPSGNVIIAGQTNSSNNIATAGSYQSTYLVGGNWRGYMAKFDADGIRQWGTYYQGAVTGDDRILACAVDFRGNIYVAGVTTSDTGIATPGAHQTTFGGGPGIWDVFLAKFNTNGERIWATYYGGWGDDEVWGSGGALATDKNGNVFMTGQTSSITGIATPGAYQTTITGTAGFLTKFDSTGVQQWGTYYSGDVTTWFTSCATDTSGNVYATGATNSSTSIASPGAYQTIYGGQNDAFLVAFTPLGQRIWGTYYGGSLSEWGLCCNTDKNGYVYLVGWTQSLNAISSPGCHQETFGGGPQDGFMVKFNYLGQRIWGTYYGGLLYDEVNSCSAGWNGDIFFSGVTQSADNISTPNSFQPVIAGNYDAFLTKFNSAGQRQWGTYFGGSNYDGGYSCNYVADDTIYLQGDAQSLNNIATSNGHQKIFGGGMQDAFLEKFIECLPIAAAQPILGPDSVCQSSNGVVFSTSPLAHAVSYQWDIPSGDTIVSGAGSTAIMVNFSSTAISGYIKVRGLNKCGDAGDSSSLYVSLYPRPVPVISGPANTCSGPGKVYSTLPGKTNYQWSTTPGGIITSGGSTIDNTATVTWNVAGTQQVYVNYIDTNGCEGLTPTILDIIVTTGPAVDVTINAGANNICAGIPVTFTAFPTNPGTNPFYQWKVNGSNVGPNNTIFTYTPSNGDQVKCELNSNAICSSNNPATSNTITMIVNPNLPVSVSVSLSANPVCAGTLVTFTATPIYGGTTPSYQWKVNGGNVGTNNSIYSYTPNNGDLITCTLNSSETCTTGNPAISNQVIITVNPILPVSLSISASSNPFCIGNSVTFTAIPTNEGTTPGYQWKVNGLNVGTNNLNYTYTPISGDLVKCILTSSEVCVTGNPATSNTITMTGTVGLPAGVSINAAPNPFCPGSPVTFTATPVNGGSNPSYQWKVNGINTGPNSPTYTFNPLNNDSVWCVMTSNLACVSGNPASSNKIILSGTLAPIVTFTACFDTITTSNAKPIKLKGGIPLGGTYSGAGVSGGYYNPGLAVPGVHLITYTYTNASLCSASKSSPIHQFTSSPFTCGNNLTDIRDSKSYPTVQIGSQCWMAANLNYGVEILSTQHQRDNCIPEKYTSPSSLLPGAYYQWDELMCYDDTPGQQGLCPPGWHVPTENDWNTLFAVYINNGFAGSPLKYSGYSGFNALLSGARFMNKIWSFDGFATYFWSSTSHGSLKAWAHAMNDFDPSVSVYPSLRSNAFSVRCLKDN